MSHSTFLAVLIAFSPLFSTNLQVETVGSDYNHWYYPENFLHEGSVCYFGGAGRDLTFDVEVARKFRCHVHIFDPTPGAISHFEEVVSSLENGTSLTAETAKTPYQLSRNQIHLLHYYPIALWEDVTEVDFFLPRNKNFISHSIHNLQKTKDSIRVQCKDLATIMQELGHTHVDFLKLNIEGGEYPVIDDIIEKNLNVKCISLELHHLPNLENIHPNEHIEFTKQRLFEYGYVLIHERTPRHITLLIQDEYDRLTRS